ncbi:hypothetical protein AVEN_76679-1, partial [Araneus ventricosus]
SFRAV